MSRTVIGRAGGLRSICCLSASTASICPLKSGRYFSTGSSRRTLPSSTSIISAVAVMGFEIEAIQTRLSGRIRFWPAMSAKPMASSAHLIAGGDQHHRAGQHVVVDERLHAGGDALGRPAGADWAAAGLETSVAVPSKRTTNADKSIFMIMGPARVPLALPVFFSGLFHWLCQCFLACATGSASAFACATGSASAFSRVPLALPVLSCLCHWLCQCFLACATGSASAFACATGSASASFYPQHRRNVKEAACTGRASGTSRPVRRRPRGFSRPAHRDYVLRVSAHHYAWGQVGPGRRQARRDASRSPASRCGQRSRRARISPAAHLPASMNPCGTTSFWSACPASAARSCGWPVAGH